jgi:hypothetical protein
VAERWSGRIRFASPPARSRAADLD